MNPLDRYADLVDDEAAFRAACDRPLPQVVRVNTLAAEADRVAAAFDEADVEYERVAWHDGLFRMPGGSPGTTWPYFHGWVHGQEEVSALPALALDPAPGETVWDACAAPGSKTSHVAARMDDRGTLVANDSNLGRLSALRHNAERLGLTNLVVTNRDARNYSLRGFEFDAFDRVLVDAPCSCEGTIRKNPDAHETWSLDHVNEISGVQRGVLRRAVQAMPILFHVVPSDVVNTFALPLTRWPSATWSAPSIARSGVAAETVVSRIPASRARSRVW